MISQNYIIIGFIWHKKQVIWSICCQVMDFCDMMSVEINHYFEPCHTLLHLLSGRGILPIFQKITIFRDKMKDFEKTKRDEAMKRYFLHSPDQEEQFKLYFTPPPQSFKIFCSTPLLLHPLLLGT